MKKAFVLALAVLATSVVAASAQGSQTASARSLASFNCSKTITLPFLTPLTGGAGFLGTEQLSWAKYAVKTLAPQMGLKVKLVGGDTPAEQGPAPAQTLAQKYIGTPSVLAVLGPSTSGNVAATTQAFYAAKLAHISPSATRTSLTKGTGGTQYSGSPAFFRDIPGDYIQGPSDANFMVNNLHVKKVVLFDFQEPYSLGLAAAADAVLKAKGVSTSRLSAPNTTTDYSRT
jgi:branched-chain amino acid transport system substrate-binding protein